MKVWVLTSQMEDGELSVYGVYPSKEKALEVAKAIYDESAEDAFEQSKREFEFDKSFNYNTNEMFSVDVIPESWWLIGEETEFYNG